MDALEGCPVTSALIQEAAEQFAHTRTSQLRYGLSNPLCTKLHDQDSSEQLVASWQRRGVTLVETLVVFAIITIVAGLVFAAMAPARERGRQSLCASNLRQIGLALNLYRQDYGGTDADVGTKMTCASLGVPSGMMFFDFVKAYIKNKDVLVCPDWRGTRTPPAAINGWDPITVSYSWLVPDEDSVPDHATFSSRVALQGESARISDCLDHNPLWNEQSLPRWEKKRVILLRLNGHVHNKLVPVRSNGSDW